MAYVGTPRNLGTDQATLASIIYGEAGNQGTTGMQAVGAVIVNRANGVSGFTGFGSGSIMGAALYPNQFQGQSTNYSPEAYTIAGNVLNGTNPDPTGGATYYANPGASSASWARNLNSSNALQIGDHYFTDNTNGTPFQPNLTGSGTTIAHGPGDNPTGFTTDPYLTMNPSDPNYGDITGIPVAGVNAPNPSTTPIGKGGIGSDAVASKSPEVSDVAPDQPLSAPVKVTLQPGVSQAVSDWISNLEKSFGAGTQAVITAAGNAIGTYFAGLANYVGRGFLFIIGIIALAIGLIFLMWDHGGKETVINMGRAVAA